MTANVFQNDSVHHFRHHCRIPCWDLHNPDSDVFPLTYYVVCYFLYDRSSSLRIFCLWNGCDDGDLDLDRGLGRDHGRDRLLHSRLSHGSNVFDPVRSFGDPDRVPDHDRDLDLDPGGGHVLYRALGLDRVLFRAHDFFPGHDCALYLVPCHDLVLGLVFDPGLDHVPDHDHHSFPLLFHDPDLVTEYDYCVDFESGS